MMMEDEDELRLVLSSSEEEESDSDDGIQMKNITDSDSSVEIFETVTRNQSEATGEVFAHESDKDQDVMRVTAKQVETSGKTVAGQMEDGRWFLVKKCEVRVRSLPITLVRSLQEEKGETIAIKPVGEDQVREGQARRSNPALSCESSTPGLGKQGRTRRSQDGIRGHKEKYVAGYQQSGNVLRTEGLTDRLSVLVTSLKDRVGMGNVRVNRLTRGKKRKVLDQEGREASDYEVNDDKVTMIDDEETRDKTSSNSLELDVNFVEVCRDGEACDDMKTRSDDDQPIDMEDKIAVDPLYSLVKPCCVKLRNIGKSDGNEIRGDCNGIRSYSNMIRRHNEIRSDGNEIRRNRNGIRSKLKEMRSESSRTLKKMTNTKIKEVLVTRENHINLDMDCTESLDEIALELQKMENAARANERSGKDHYIPASRVFHSEDDEALRRIFEETSLSVTVSVEKSSPVSIPEEMSRPVAGPREKSCSMASDVVESIPVGDLVKKNCVVVGLVETRCPVTVYEASRVEKGCSMASLLEPRCPATSLVEKGCPVVKSCPMTVSLVKSCPVTGPVVKCCPVTGSVEETFYGVEVTEVETGAAIVASENGETCNGVKIVQVDAEAAVQALKLSEAVFETTASVDGDVVEVSNDFDENTLEGANVEVVPTSNHSDALSIGETGMDVSPKDVCSGGEEGEVIDEAPCGENGGITEILENAGEIELMNGKPLEKGKEIPDQDDKTAPPSSRHDAEPASPSNSVEIVTDESFEDWESVSYEDWENVFGPSPLDEVNNNSTFALTVDHSKDTNEYPGILSRIELPNEEEVSKKYVDDLSKKPVVDEDYLSDITGNFCSLTPGDKVLGSTDAVLPSSFPQYRSSKDLGSFPLRDSTLLGLSLDEASSQGSSVVKSSSQGSVLIKTASESSGGGVSQASSSVETSYQASVVETSSHPSLALKTSSQPSSVVEELSQASAVLEELSQASSVVEELSQASSVLEELSESASVVEELSQASSVVQPSCQASSVVQPSSQSSSVVEELSQASSEVEPSSQASSVVQCSSQASSLVCSSPQDSLTLFPESPYQVYQSIGTRSECSLDREDANKGSSVSRTHDDHDDHQPGTDAVVQGAADICDDLNMTNDDDNYADDDLLLIANDETFDDLSPDNINVLSPEEVVVEKTLCQGTSSPIVCVVLSKSVDLTIKTVSSKQADVSNEAVVSSKQADVSNEAVVSSKQADVSNAAVVSSKPFDGAGTEVDVSSRTDDLSSKPVEMCSVVYPKNYEKSSYQQIKTRDASKSGKGVAKFKKNPRNQSIFDISIDESSVVEYKNCAANLPAAASSNSSPNLSSLVKGFAKEIMSNVSSSSPCSSTSTTAKTTKDARASCPQSPSITSSTGPGPAIAIFEDSDSDSSSDDDVIILEESGVSSSNVNQVKTTLAVPEKTIKPHKKIPEPRPSITNVYVDLWKGLGSEDNPRLSNKEGDFKKTKSKEPRKELNGNQLNPKRSDSQHPKFKTNESHRPKSKVLCKDSLKSSPKVSPPPHASSKGNPSSKFKIPKGPSKVLGNPSHSKEMIQYGGKLMRIKNFLKEEDIIPNFDQLMKDEDWHKIESMYDKVTNIKKSVSDKKINDITDETEVNDLKSQNMVLKKLETDEERKKFSQRQFKNSASTDPAANLTFHGYRSLKDSNRTKNLPTDSFSISGGKLLPQSGFKRRNWTEESKVREAQKKKIKINDFGLVMKKVFVHKFNKKLRSTKSKARQSELDEFLTYLGHYKTGQEETANFLTYYNSRKELCLDQVKEVIDVENQYSTFTNYYGEADDFFCKDCNKRHKFCQ